MTVHVPPPDYTPLPQNIQCEQALLGSILAYDDSWPLVADKLRPEHFHEGLHARLYAKVLELSTEGKFVSPIVLKTHFDNDPTLQEVGGFDYIARLLGGAGPRASISHYAEIIRGLADRRAVIRASEEMRRCAADETEAGEVRKSLSAHISDLMSIFENSGHRKTTHTLHEAGNEAMARLTRIMSGAPDPSAILSGIAGLDRLSGGFRRGEYIVLGARPSMGKTGLAVQITANIARRGGGVAYFSQEMPTQLLFPRFWSSHLWTPSSYSPTYQDILRGNVPADRQSYLAQAIAEIKDWPIIIDEEPGLSPQEIEARARVMAARLKARGHSLDLVVVDHLHKLHMPGAVNRVAEFSDISAALAEAAKRLNAPVLVLAQLSRALEAREDKRPTLADLRESGAIEQDADVVLFCYRDAYYLERAKGKDMGADLARLQDLADCQHSLELIMAKQRSGPIDTVHLWADMGANVILDRSEAPA